ncbi:alginate lyase family protein [Namhaeicola litoreus]|uniref:Alginate lyase family protein n=1 Tax=Namhaeicola litoreus TaxID=1052145 RepID=A0ABW3Y6H1_9FLAO
MNSIKTKPNLFLKLASLFIFLVFIACSKPVLTFQIQAENILKDSILALAKENLLKKPVTVTAKKADRSVGGLHDFYSEGDYWWPDTTNLDGPFIQRDGMTNPDNFTEHREALMRFSEIVGNLTSAYLITKDSIYALKTLEHCKAWFINEDTKMNPHLNYAQAIKGRFTGRGIGIIDGIHFMEVVQSIVVLDHYKQVDPEILVSFKYWFSEFLIWLKEHPYGKAEMIHPNNHGTCWNMQVALYAKFTNNDSILNFCRERFKNNLLPDQMAENGSFPLELKRTKPFGYSLFNLDAMVMNCLILSDKENDLWHFISPVNKNIKLGLEFMKPYVKEKKKWPLTPDVMYWDQWPVAQPAFLFGAIAFEDSNYFELWSSHTHFPKVDEVKRNLPIRNPLLWLDEID